MEAVLHHALEARGGEVQLGHELSSLFRVELRQLPLEPGRDLHHLGRQTTVSQALA